MQADDARAFQNEDKARDSLDYDGALAAAEFGVFNVFVLTATFAGCTGMLFASTSVAFVMPSAACDLELTLKEKGHLNSITYTGMLIAAVPWAIISDTRGRKLVITLTYLLDALFVLLAACSQTKWQLMIFKFFSGCCTCGAFSALMTYIAELHTQINRLRVILLAGVMLTTTSLTLPGLAVLIIPKKLNTEIMGLTFHSWQFFLAACALPSAICGMMFLMLPESPRYLISKQNNEQALQTFQRIFALNTGRPKEEYPIKGMYIRSSTAVHNETACSILLDGYEQIKPLFSRDYILIALLLFSVELSVLMSQNTVRLWVPDLFALFEEYTALQSEGKLDHHFDNMSATLCSVLEYSTNKSDLVVRNITSCMVHITVKSYMNNFVVGVAALIAYFSAIVLVKYIAIKTILTGSLLFTGVFGFLWYFSNSQISNTLILSVYLAMENICSSSLMNASVSYFPTQMRTMIISISLLFGRCGAVIGNNVFPILIRAGCFATTFALGCIGVFTCLISLLLPNPADVPFT